MERVMKIQEVILKAMAGKLKWWEAAEIIGVTDRTMRRWGQDYEENGYSRLWDYRKRSPSPKRVSVAGFGEGLWLYPGQKFYFKLEDLFEKKHEEEGVEENHK